MSDPPSLTTPGWTPVTGELSDRMAAAITAASELLGLAPPEQAQTADPGSLAAMATAVADVLDAGVGATSTRHGQRHEGAELRSAHAAQLERIRRRFEPRFDALDRVRAAMLRLREIGSPGELIARAPSELCAGSDLLRVVISLVRDGEMVAESVHIRDDPVATRSTLEALRGSPARLEHPLIEAEVIRRRRAMIVSDAQVQPRVHRPTAEIMGWQRYLAAPLGVRGEVFGVIQADCGPTGELEVLHRDVLWEFATGLGQAYDGATLSRALRREREQTRRFLEWLNGRSAELSDASIDFAIDETRPARLQLLSDRPPLAGGRDDREVFGDLLTRREIEVLRLLAEGRTNKAIADDLVVSAGTVKFHINNILRKLRVANRAEAVSCYFRLLGVRSADS